MSYQQWVDLFGKPADDAAVKDALKRAGITNKIKIAKDKLRISADVPGTGMRVTFTDESVLDKSGKGIVGRPILTAVLMSLEGGQIYAGPLPQKLEKTTSRDALRARLGKPAESSDGPISWDAWWVDGIEFQPTYADDLQSIDRVVVRVPGAR